MAGFEKRTTLLTRPEGQNCMHVRLAAWEYRCICGFGFGSFSVRFSTGSPAVAKKKKNPLVCIRTSDFWISPNISNIGSRGHRARLSKTYIEIVYIRITAVQIQKMASNKHWLIRGCLLITPLLGARDFAQFSQGGILGVFYWARADRTAVYSGDCSKSFLQYTYFWAVSQLTNCSISISEALQPAETNESGPSARTCGDLLL